MTIRIRVVTPITTEGFRTPEDAASLASEGVDVSFVNIDAGPASIECDYEIMLAQPATIARIVEAERQGADAVVIDCMGDPGLFGARECVSIPVLGPMQTAMGVAAMMGHKFSVVTVLRRILPMIETQAAIYGMTSKLASARSVDIPGARTREGPRGDQARADRGGPEGRRRGRRRLHHLRLHRNARLRRGGARRIACARRLERARNRSRAHRGQCRSGVGALELSHSKHAYRQPPKKAIVGYAQSASAVESALAAE